MDLRRALATAVSGLVVAGSALVAVGTPTAVASLGEPVVYSGAGVEVWRNSGRVKLLADTPREARTFVGERLDAVWQAAGGGHRCGNSATITVKRYHERRYLLASYEGMTPHGDDPDSCAGPGRRAIYAWWSGEWRRVLASRAEFGCDGLAAHDVPRQIGGAECRNDADRLVAYEPPRTHGDAEDVARLLAIEVNHGRMAGALNWGTPEVVDAMAEYHDLGYRYGDFDDMCHLRPAGFRCEFRVFLDDTETGTIWVTVNGDKLDLHGVDVAIGIIG